MIMKKLLLFALCALLVISMIGCSPESEKALAEETLTGVAKGHNGNITVSVTKKGDKITAVEILEENETPDIARPAFEQIPAAIVKANSTAVDAISGATVTSKAIMNAVNNALDPESYPAPEKETNNKSANKPAPVSATKVFQGFGIANNARIGPGKDNTDTQVYSINQVFANVLFDEEGKILSLYVDQLEVATPNYDGEGMPHFSGFPGQGGYNNDENHDGKIDGKTPDTEDHFISEVNSWETKRDRGENYQMGVGTWSDQMDAYQDLFVGKTVEEVEEWFAKYTSDINGRPLKPDSKNEEDLAKYEALSEEEKNMLADTVTGATMSLNDAHGNIIEAIKKSFENAVAVNLSIE
ncbi:MAG: FMN-binding protein [Firmicutes bacterium]|nr:FMN-binding protein [Bacillota bacterium]